MHGSNTWRSVVQTGPPRALPSPYNVHTHLLYPGRPLLDVGAVAWGQHPTDTHFARVCQPGATDHLPGSTRNPRYRR